MMNETDTIEAQAIPKHSCFWRVEVLVDEGWKVIDTASTRAEAKEDFQFTATAWAGSGRLLRLVEYIPTVLREAQL